MAIIASTPITHAQWWLAYNACMDINWHSWMFRHTRQSMGCGANQKAAGRSLGGTVVEVRQQRLDARGEALPPWQPVEPPHEVGVAAAAVGGPLACARPPSRRAACTAPALGLTGASLGSS